MPETAPSATAPVLQRLLLLRHGEVASHRGDVPVTEAGLRLATEVGRHLAGTTGPLRLLSGDTRRTRETADAVAAGARDAGQEVTGPSVSFAMRNPDLYVAGQRVDMVSSAAALAAQVDGMDEEAAAQQPFFADFFTMPDRIGWWLRHPGPPGDDADAVARRVEAFAASLADLPEPGTTVGITHSPLLRACAVRALGEDPGEPAWLAGVDLEVRADRSVQVTYLPDPP